ncbi:hypothetical protein UFOVP455_30 [uncultured Caudovirales phage]|jgi:hypothetical protein|uniref:Uncharacterized protein n=1 Tax=uncultured Caudovirales phage TaxID=2100421 RepID=A0A6J5MDI0_9CAUD|nr:hypothetical protein UFOVP455_30 [uncultured Caudovirales phage]
MSEEQDKKDYVLKTDIVHWVDKIELAYAFMMKQDYASGFKKYTQVRNALIDQIYNYIKKREEKNDK